MTDYELLSNTPPINNPAIYSALAVIPFPMDDYMLFSASWPHTPEEIKNQHKWQAFRGCAGLKRIDETAQ